MLSNRNPQIQLQAASALRNLVFKNSVNKEEVRRTGGLTKAVDILKQTSHNTDLVSSEIQKHVTGKQLHTHFIADLGIWKTFIPKLGRYTLWLSLTYC